MLPGNMTEMDLNPTQSARLAPPADGQAGAASPPIPAPDAGPSEANLLLIRQATARRKTVDRAARNARTSAIVTLVIGVLAIPTVLLWPSWSAAMITAGLCVVGVVEFSASGRLRRADPAAARLLGQNQLALLGLITLYCAAQMISFSPEQAKNAAISPEVRSQLGHMPDMTRSIDAQIDRWMPLLTYGFYGLVAFMSVLFQGGMAWYYFSRARHVEEFNAHTPEWVRRVLRETRA